MEIPDYIWIVGSKWWILSYKEYEFIAIIFNDIVETASVCLPITHLILRSWY